MTRAEELKKLISKAEKQITAMKDELQKIVQHEGKTLYDVLVRERGNLIFFTRKDGMTIVTSAHRNEYNERDVWSAGSQWDEKTSIGKTENNIVLSDERMSIKEVASWFAATAEI